MGACAAFWFGVVARLLRARRGGDAVIIRCCPECHSVEVRRSRPRSFLEIFLLPLVLLRPFRCEKCRHRYYGFVRSRKLTVGEEAEPSN